MILRARVRGKSIERVDAHDFVRVDIGILAARNGFNTHYIGGLELRMSCEAAKAYELGHQFAIDLDASNPVPEPEPLNWPGEE